MNFIIDAVDFLAMSLSNAAQVRTEEIMQRRDRLQHKYPGVVVDLSGSSVRVVLASYPNCFHIEGNLVTKGALYDKMFSKDMLTSRYEKLFPPSQRAVVKDIVTLAAGPISAG